jgi:hypothetical protein
MAVSNSVVAVGSATTMVVAPSVDTQHVTLQNQQPKGDVGDYSREGYVWAATSFFPIASGGTVSFGMVTGAYGAQFEYYNIVAENNSVHAYLIEGPTFTAGAAVTAYNLDRSDTRAYSAVLTSATNVTGGTVISSEYVVASNQAGGSFSSTKIITLKPSTHYAMNFVGTGNAKVFFELGFTEQYNGGNDIYLGAAGSAIRLRGGDVIQLNLYPGEAVYASTRGQSCNLAIMRQD